MHERRNSTANALELRLSCTKPSIYITSSLSDGDLAKYNLRQTENGPSTLQWRHNGRIASQITSLTSVYSTDYSDADQRSRQSSASLAFVRGIHRGQVNSLHKWPVTQKMFPFDDVIMTCHADCTFDNTESKPGGITTSTVVAMVTVVMWLPPANGKAACY